MSEGAGETAPQGDGFEQPGDEVGPYRLISQIGEGGFGTVWIAERQHPFTQWVALKIVKPGMDSRAVIARFEQERQALAVMDHPHVARVFDGGMASSGRPYFAMELVKGDPVHEFCDGCRMPLRARLELFLQICDAVHHAHAKGIIHRDLKPANILVSASEGDRPVAKVIDFGIAKALLHAEGDDDLFTKSGQLFGTPAYMSPEQASPGTVPVDGRSDVFSLGVILYELLAGVLPCEPAQSKARTYGELQRAICRFEAIRPSERLARMTAEEPHAVERLAARRGLDAEGLVETLRSELEWIPMKAIRPERSERYASAAELGADIAAFLNGQPIMAAPESIGYRARKRLMRHQPAVAAAAAILIVASLGALALWWQRADAQRWAQRAALAEASLDAVIAFHGAGGTATRIDEIRSVGRKLESAGGAGSEPMALVHFLVAQAALAIDIGEDGTAAADAGLAIVRDAVARQDSIEGLAARFSTACFLHEFLAVGEACHARAGHAERACELSLERLSVEGCAGIDRVRLAMNATRRCLEAGRIEDALRVSEELGRADGQAVRLLRAQVLERAGRADEAARLRAETAQ